MFVILFCGPSMKGSHALFCAFWKGAFFDQICVSLGCVGFNFIFPAMLRWSSGHVVLQLIHSNSITYLFSVIWRKFPHRFSLSLLCFQIQILFELCSWSRDSWGSISYCILKFTFVPSSMASVDWLRQSHGLSWRYAMTLNSQTFVMQ